MRILLTILTIAAMQSAAGCVLDSSSSDPALGTTESAAKAPPCVRTCVTEMLSSVQTGYCLGCMLDLNGTSSFHYGMDPGMCDVWCTLLRLENGECTDGPL